jgi:hypothetical protein
MFNPDRLSVTARVMPGAIVQVNKLRNLTIAANDEVR